MIPIPRFFVDHVPEKNHLEVHDWWDNLNSSVQSKIILFWENSSEIQDVNVDSIANYVELQNLECKPNNHEIYDVEFPQKEFYEYLVNQEVHELYVRLWVGNTMHICSAHKKMREFILMGFIPKIFDCPFELKNCITKKIIKKYGKYNSENYIKIME